jgi:hypothetical protein
MHSYWNWHNKLVSNRWHGLQLDSLMPTRLWFHCWQWYKMVLWIYDYIPLLSLLKFSITLFLLLFTWTISVTYYLLRFYFKHHLLLGFHLPLSPSQFLLNVGNMFGMCWKHLPYLASGSMFRMCWECVGNTILIWQVMSKHLPLQYLS